MKPVKIGLIGLGTIGSGVYDAVLSNGGIIQERTGVSLQIKGVCDKDQKALDGIDRGKVEVVTSNADELLNDEQIDIIVELIGGVHPAKDIVMKAIRNKKHVVTANKALLSEHWKEILTTAGESRVFVSFEASVGGGIPIIRTLKESLAANNISTIYGILNGTTNFILSRMVNTECSFEEALKVAQEKGIAEKDPELDISGKDSAHKLAILALLGFGLDVRPEDVYTEGITDIAPQDLKNAMKWGYGVKLLAIAKDTPEGVQLRVHPTLLPLSHLLSDVRGEDNAIFVKGDLLGESLLFGKGAGRKPTSSSVMGDIIGIARHLSYFGRDNSEPFALDYASGKKKVKAMDELAISYYLRFSVIDKPGVLAGISSVLAEHQISIASVSQEERNQGETVPVIIQTHRAEEGRMKKAISKINGMDFVTDRTVVIRIEE
ncbi:MAG: homoserine dehydrogenase [Candidatus Omnitrophica bacterium]|nr:homoserine dehydrogenase [Candidatus Omnitrophota bacterium]